MLIAASEIQPGDTIVSHKYGTHDVININPIDIGLLFGMGGGKILAVKPDEQILVIRKADDLL